MSDDLTTEAGLDAALREVRGLPGTRDRIRAFAALAGRADAGGSRIARRAARTALIEERCGENVVGLTAPALAAFAWLLEDHDRDPDGGTNPFLLRRWITKMIPYAAEDAAVPRATVDALLADHRRRAEAWGASPLEVKHTAFWTAIRFSDLERLPPLLADLHGGYRDEDSSVPPAKTGLAAIITGQADRAIAALRPMAEVHVGFAAWLLRPLIWAGEDEEAERRYRRLAADGFAGQGHDGLTFEFAARLRDREVLRSWLPRLAGQVPSVAGDTGEELIHLAQGCAALAECGDEPLAVPLPADLPDPPPRDGRGRVKPSDAAGPLWTATEVWAAANDARNGHAHVSVTLSGDRRFVLDPAADPCRVPAELRAELRGLWEEHVGGG